MWALQGEAREVPSDFGLNNRATGVPLTGMWKADFGDKTRNTAVGMGVLSFEILLWAELSH